MGLLPSRDLQPLGKAFNPPTPAYLQTLQAALPAPLPQDYANFLKTYGVCTCKQYSSLRLAQGLHVDINVFYGSDPDDSYDLLQIWRDLHGRLPEGLLPMACDAFGNLLCLKLGAGAEAGSVWFWDQESEETRAVAPSFSKFLQEVRVEEN